MKIVVPIKSVATLDDEFRIDDAETGIDPEDLEWRLNEWDRFSVEAALQLAEQHGGEVVVVSVGDEEADEAMLECLARGVDRAVRVWDETLAGADSLLVARVLAAVVERERPDLVLCGVQSSDAANGATGIALAAHLGLHHVAVVKSIELDEPGERMTVERELEGGLTERLKVGLPALLTVQTGINEPRYATLRAIKQAADKPFAVVSPTDVGLTGDVLAAAAGSRVRRLRPPQRGAGASMIDGSPVEIAARIMEIVRERMSA